MKLWQKFCIAITAVIVVGMVADVMGAANVVRSFFKSKPAAKTITGYVGGNWTIIDSIIPVCTDSGTVLLTATGVVDLNPNQTVYIGFAADSLANRQTTFLDTVQYTGNSSVRGVEHQPFMIQMNKNYTAAATDTVWLCAANKSNAAGPAKVKYTFISGVFNVK